MARQQDVLVTKFQAIGHDELIQATNKAAHTMRGMKKAGEETNQMFRLLRGGAGQLGHQVQDIAVQLQMGTNAMIVFGQQGSQIASLFGPYGAIAGAVLAIGAAIGSSLAPAIFKTTNHTKEMADALEYLNGISRDAEEGLTSLTEDMLLLARAGQQVVQAEYAAALIKANNVLKNSIGGVISEFDKIKGVGVGFSDVGDFVDALNKDLGFSIESTRGFKEVAQEVGQQFGVSGVEAEKLGRRLIQSLAKIQSNPTIESIRELQAELSALALNDGAPKAVKIFVSSLNQYLIGAEKATDKTKELSDILANLQTQLNMPLEQDSGTTQKADKQQEFIKSLQQEIELYGASTAERTRAKAIELGITGERLEQVIAFAEQLDLMRELSQAQKDSLSEAERQHAEAERVQNTQQKFVDSLQQQLTLEGMTNTQKQTYLAYQQGIRGEQLAQVALLGQQLDLLQQQKTAAAEIQQIQRSANEVRQQYLMTESERLIQNYEMQLGYLQAVGATQTEMDLAKAAMQEEYAMKMFESNEHLMTGMRAIEQIAVTALTKIIKEGASLNDVLRATGDIIITSIIQSFAQMAARYIAEKTAMWLFDKGLQAATVGTTAASATAVGAAWATPAALASLATLGTNAAAASAAIATTTAVAKTAALASFEGGGFTGMGARAGGLDGRGGFLAMLHPNETVVDHQRNQNYNNSININLNGLSPGEFMRPESRRQLEAATYRGAMRAYRRNR